MKGTKLVSDYLTDRKRSLFDKRRQLVVTDATGQIVWLVNERPADSFRVTDNTKMILCLEALS
jgi:tRNA(Ile)-lysidine synthase